MKQLQLLKGTAKVVFGAVTAGAIVYNEYLMHLCGLFVLFCLGVLLVHLGELFTPVSDD